jgi:hypothetical protein
MVITTRNNAMDCKNLLLCGHRFASMYNRTNVIIITVIIVIAIVKTISSYL